MDKGLTDKIRKRAYEIFLKRGGKPGNPAADWAIAEKEILKEEEKPSEAPAKKILKIKKK